VLGIAKLLLQVVHVKRETLWVVSLAMTGLMLHSRRDFHIIIMDSPPPDLRLSPWTSVLFLRLWTLPPEPFDLLTSNSAA